jgi:hypothetical protein
MKDFRPGRVVIVAETGLADIDDVVVYNCENISTEKGKAEKAST